jgi:quercetin dioxygenase-like cupin family protein
MDAFLVPPGGGERIENPLGGEIVFKARGAQTGEALTVFEAANAPGQGPPLHVHSLLDELIYVIDGTIRVRLNDRVERAAAGACVFIPRGTPHTWAVASDGSARLLVVVARRGSSSSSRARQARAAGKPRMRSAGSAATTSRWSVHRWPSPTPNRPRASETTGATVQGRLGSK